MPLGFRLSGLRRKAGGVAVSRACRFAVELVPERCPREVIFRDGGAAALGVAAVASDLSSSSTT